MNENTFVDSSFFQFDVFCLFFVFWAMLTSSTYFFVELQQKKRKLKNLFGRQSLGAQTGIPGAQTAWICHWKSHMVCLNTPYHFTLFKGCLPQILLGPFLNALSYTSLLKQTLSGWASDNERVALWLVKLRFPCRTETQSLRLPEHRRQ